MPSHQMCKGIKIAQQVPDAGFGQEFRPIKPLLQLSEHEGFTNTIGLSQNWLQSAQWPT